MIGLLFKVTHKRGWHYCLSVWTASQPGHHPDTSSALNLWTSKRGQQPPDQHSWPRQHKGLMRNCAPCLLTFPSPPTRSPIIGMSETFRPPCITVAAVPSRGSGGDRSQWSPENYTHNLFIAHRYNNDVKHIKILTHDGCFHIAENKKFRSILVSHSLSCFFFFFFLLTTAFHQ